MDDKTLEYMGQRVDKAREILKKIQDIDKILEALERKSNDIDAVSFLYYEGGIAIGNKYSKTFYDPVVQSVKAATIVALTELRTEKQNELDAL